MKKKSLLILSTVVALSAIMVISAALTYTLNFNMNANVLESGAVTITIGGTTYNNNDNLAINWTTVTPGQQYTKTMTITSTVNNAVTPTLTPTGLPSGWTLTLSDTSAIPAKGTVTRDLVLTVPSDALASSPSWTAVLTVSS